jgi:hypothetical protein
LPFLIQAQLEKLMSKNYFLNLSAKEAYKAYVRAYESHSLKHIYDVQNLGQLNKIKCIAFIKTLWLIVGRY